MFGCVSTSCTGFEVKLVVEGFLFIAEGGGCTPYQAMLYTEVLLCATRFEIPRAVLSAMAGWRVGSGRHVNIDLKKQQLARAFSKKHLTGFRWHSRMPLTLEVCPARTSIWGNPRPASFLLLPRTEFLRVNPPQRAHGFSVVVFPCIELAMEAVVYLCNALFS